MWCGKWKCIHAYISICPASLCLLIGAFNPVIFKVTINIYNPITVFLTVSGLFSIDLLLLLCFLPREVPLVSVVKLVWWCWILLTFACLESFWFLHQIWIRVLPDCGFSPLVILNISCHSFLACRALFSN